MIVNLSFMVFVLINLINGQVHLSRSNLVQICGCDINSTSIGLYLEEIVSIDANTFQGLTKLKRPIDAKN